MDSYNILCTCTWTVSIVIYTVFTNRVSNNIEYAFTCTFIVTNSLGFIQYTMYMSESPFLTSVQISKISVFLLQFRYLKIYI